ncbi:hypothetical protein PAPHI01_2728, partial [Pancytospora philotis]
MRKIPEQIRRQVQELFSRGLALCAIAREAGISVGTVHSIVRSRPHEAPRPHAGRRPVVTERMLHLLIRAAESSVVRSLEGLRNYLLEHTGVNVSRAIIWNIMREHGYANYVRALKPRLTTRHKRARLGFARATIGYSDRAWERVVFTDECKFTVYGHGGPRTVWRRRGPPTEPHHFRPV